MKTIADIICCHEKLREDHDTAVDTLAALENSERFGNVTLAGGSGTPVADTNITANSIVILGRKTIGGTAGNLYYTLDPGVAIVVVSSNTLDTSVVSYHIKY